MSLVDSVHLAWDTYRRLPKLRAAIDALLLLFGLFLVDGLSKHSMSLRMMYIAPIWFAAQRGGRRAGLVLCVATTTVLTWTDCNFYYGRGDTWLHWTVTLAILTAVMLLIESQESRLKNYVDLASSDTLTGVGNRLALDRYAQKLFAKQRDNVAIIMVDCDYFKELNDTFGHAFGDHVLKTVARLLKRSFQPNGLVARIGGDEFVCISIGRKQDEIERIMERVAERLCIATEILNTQPSISWGSAWQTSEGISLSALLEQADRNMYHHKGAKAPPLRYYATSVR